jgi:hypothetical protein
MTKPSSRPVPRSEPLSFTHDHKGRALSPAMSQLLNSTVIPVPKRRQRLPKKNHLLRKRTLVAAVGPQSPYFGDIEDSLNDEDDYFNLSITSDVLSSSNDDASEIFERAGSPNSVESDWTSDDCAYSCPSPGIYSPKRATSVRKKVELPLVESCNDHPLSVKVEDVVMVDQQVERSDPVPSFDDSSANGKSKITLPRSFVSNLSLSLKALQSMAASISSSQDKLYARNLFAFSPRQMDEPIPQQLPNHKPSRAISLTTYNIQSTVIAQLRPRELRINSQFYRVYAAETLMRKNGKLDENFLGRAKPILEPRKDNQKFFLDDGDEVFGIRKRFVSQFDVREKRNKSITLKASRWHVWNADDADF